MELVPKHKYDRKLSYFSIGNFEFETLSVPFIKQLNTESRDYIYKEQREHHKKDIHEEVCFL